MSIVNIVNNLNNATGVLPPFDPTATEGPSYRDGITVAEGGAADPLADKNVFLNLLVAQIRNQDPLNPTDGIQFVTQLAQFTQLEQSLAMRQSLDGIKADLDQAAAPANPAP